MVDLDPVLGSEADYLPPAGAIDDLLAPPVIPQGRRPVSEVVTELGDAERW